MPPIFFPSNSKSFGQRRSVGSFLKRAAAPRLPSHFAAEARQLLDRAPRRRRGTAGCVGRFRRAEDMRGGGGKKRRPGGRGGGGGAGGRAGWQGFPWPG